MISTKLTVTSLVGVFLGQRSDVQVQAHMARFSVFAFVFQVAVVSSSSSHCSFLSLNAFGGFSSSWFFGAGDLNGFLATVVRVPPPHPPSFFPSTNSFSVDG